MSLRTRNVRWREPRALGPGEIDSQTALELSTLVRNWILSVHARSELELKKINIDGPGESSAS